MKLILLSDVHLVDANPICRVDDLRMTQLKKLEWIFQEYVKIKQMEKCVILQAGDLFNRPKNYGLLFNVMFLFSKYKPMFYSIRGQHDTYYRDMTMSTATNFNTLAISNYINVLDDEPTPLDGLTDVYGVSYGGDIPIVDDRDKFNILVIHKEISDIRLPGMDAIDCGDFLFDHQQFDLILAGDIHRKFHCSSDGRFLFNTGPLLRFTADPYNFTHSPGYFLFDTEERKYEFKMYPGILDAELAISRTHLERNEKFDIGSDMFADFIASMKEISTKRVGIGDAISAILEELGDDELTLLVERFVKDG